MTDKSAIDEINAAFTSAVVKVMEAVAGSAGSASGSTQQTAGAQGSVGGNAVEAGQGSQLTSADAQQKTDIGGPESTESYNVSQLQDIAAMAKSNAKLYDVSATALGLASLASGANMYQQQVNQTGHADEEYSSRKAATTIRLVTVADATKEGTDNTNKG